MMQNINSNRIPMNKIGSANITNMNGNSTNVFLQNAGQPPMPENFIFQSVDPSLDDDDSDSDTAQGFDDGSDFLHNASGAGVKPGKKTKGRVKIKMEFIENKLRRYTTFSKRKTGIMKKAYELATLTGTQVMLLVASETGHVYTFATRKLQPMITSESGKALIQTCLNSPDPPPGTQSGNSLEQRMNPSGYEETELSCVVEQEEQTKTADSPQLKPQFPVAPSVVSAQQRPEKLEPPPTPKDTMPSLSLSSAMSSASVPIMSTQVPSFILQTREQLGMSQITTSTNNNNNNSISISSSSPAVAAPATNSQSNTINSSIPTLQIPLLLPQGAAISMINSSGQPLGQAISVSQTTQPSQTVKPSALSHVVSRLNALSSSQTNNSGELNTPLPVSTPAALNIMPSMTPGIVMYHTPQGVVYATPTQNIQDRTIFNFPQSAATIAMTPNDHNTAQQIITIPVPVSVATNSTIQLAPPPAAENNSKSSDSKPSPTKKLKK